jgi:hypothetical protein
VLPALIDDRAARRLARAALEAAHGRVERRLFASILRRARDDVLELEMVHRDLPGVLAGDPAARAAFRGVLDGAAERGIGRGMGPAGWGEGWIPAPDGPVARPCDPSFFVSPLGMAHLIDGVARASEGDTARYERDVDVLIGLWQRTAPLERLERHARRGRETLRDGLRLIARDLEGSLAVWEQPRGPRTPGLTPDAPGGPPLPGGLGEPPFPAGGAPWPGPDDGPPIPWPPPGGPGGPPVPPGGGPGGPIPPGGDPGGPPGVPWPGADPFDPCAFLHDACRRAVRAAARGLRPEGLPTSTWATGITGLSPRWACPHDHVTIQGYGFGPTRPADVSVLFGALPAAVVSWSDTAIVVEVPEGAGPCCVGFRSATSEAGRRAAYHRGLRALGEALASAGCLAIGDSWAAAPYVPAAPPCNPDGSNRFTGSVPVVEVFTLNGGTDVTVEPGTHLILAWRVSNALSVRIRRIAGVGPALDQTAAPVGTLDAGAYAGTEPADATYKLQAINRCGAAQAEVEVHLRKVPALHISGVELVQAIQRFDQNDPAQNNSVPLVARKATLARVYVSGGVTDWQFPVTGEILVYGPGGFLGSAQPLAAHVAAFFLNRSLLGSSLNFELPWPVLTGPVTLTVRVRTVATPHTSDPGWQAQEIVSANFVPRRRVTLIKVLVADDGRSVPAPTTAQYLDDLSVARRLLPVAEDGFLLVFAPGQEQIGTEHDLATADGWDDLMDDLEDLFEDLEAPGDPVILAALVPDLAAYGSSGRIGFSNVLSPNIWEGREDQEPVMVNRTANPDSFAHELGHVFGLDHSLCGGGPKDGRLPMFSIETLGVDVIARMTLDPTGTRDLMAGGASCRPIWPSIVTWRLIFDMLA